MEVRKLSSSSSFSSSSCPPNANNAPRNVGILFGFLVFFFAMYILAAEYAKPPKSKGEVLVFSSGKLAHHQPSKSGAQDLELQLHHRDGVVVSPEYAAESGSFSSRLARDRAVFHWEDLCYDITTKGDDRRILDSVDGWVKPGTSTALMVSYNTLM